MKLKEVQIVGFKSFPKKVKLRLDSGVTAFVGPNGCGKTNIVDAIRWALGEQRPTILRCERMDELIFGGSEKKKPFGLAEVSLLFDNEGGLPIDFSEVAVTRRFFRSGESEYLINNTPCRWRDISELFLDTGLSSKAYSLFEREMVDRVLSSESGFRRAFFEEASGTAKYRERRGLILKKLEANREDFARLMDLLTEVERQERSLKRQAGKARRYLELKKELDQKSVKAFSRRFQSWKREAEDLFSQMNERQRHIEEVRQEVEVIEEKMGKRREVFKENAMTRSQALSTLKTLREEMRELDREMALTLERKKILMEGLDRSLEEREGLVSRLPLLEKDVEEKKVRLERLEKEVREKRSDLLQLEENLKRMEEESQRRRVEEEGIQRDLFTLEVKRDGLLEKKRSLVEEERREVFEEENLEKIQREKDLILHEIETRLGEIQNQREEGKKSLQKFFDSLQNNPILPFAYSQKEIEEIKGMKEILGTLRDVITIVSGYELAVEGALESRLWLLLVSNQEDGMRILETLHEKRRFAIAPLDNFSNQHSAFSNQHSAFNLPPLLRFVTCEERYKPLLETLLGSFYMVEDLQTAHYIRSKDSQLRNGIQFVTLNGEVLEAQGFLRGGSVKSSNGEEGPSLSLFSPTREEEFEEILQKKIGLEEERQNLIRQGEERRRRREDLRRNLVKVGEEIALLDERIAGLKDHAKENGDFETIERILEERRKEVLQMRMELMEREGEFEKAKREIERKEGEIHETQSFIEKNKESASELERVIRELDETHEVGEEKLETLVGKEKRLVMTLEEMGEPTLFEEMEQEERGLKEKRERLSILKEEFHHLQLQRAEIETQRKDVREEVLRDYQMDLENTPEDQDEITLEEIERLKENLAFLEPINMAAFEEHKEVSERFQFLTSQKEDLEKAKENLEESLKVLDREARTRFIETFEKIRENFQDLFLRLFDGGRADLLLDGGGDPLQSEIEIIASPKGKRFQNIEQLSAGERALTAIALLFSFYYIKPAPFCILDEIDAPLDDANVLRFTQLVKEVSKKSQVCLITHNKRTMEIADTLYGITMEEPGVSKIISAKFQREDSKFSFDKAEVNV